MLASALILWAIENDRAQARGDRLMRHAVRIAAESEEPTGEGYLLQLSHDRKWVVCPV